MSWPGVGVEAEQDWKRNQLDMAPESSLPDAAALIRKGFLEQFGNGFSGVAPAFRPSCKGPG